MQSAAELLSNLADDSFLHSFCINCAHVTVKGRMSRASSKADMSSMFCAED